MTAPSFDDLDGVLSPDVLGAIGGAVDSRLGLLLLTPPGIAATMIARRLPSLLEPLTAPRRDYVDTAYELLGLGARGTDVPPFRAPHHTCSAGAIAGTIARPGEATLASFGVLYLDELPEFSARTIEVLAAWLRVRAKRASRGALDCAPMVVASAMPCPCGWLGSQGRHSRRCCCKPEAIERYLERVTRAAEQLQLEVVLDVPSITLADLRRAS